MAVTRWLSLVLVSPACSAALEVNSCQNEGECEETGLMQLQRMSSHLSTPQTGGICCYTGCGVAPQGCNPVFDPSDPNGNGHCSKDLDTCRQCAEPLHKPDDDIYCAVPSLLEEKKDGTPETGGVCCYDPGCGGCNAADHYCSQSKSSCDECVAESEKKDGGYCPAPSQPTPSPTPNGTSGVCCFNPGCQGCNDEHHYCSQSKERCDECVAQSANKNGGYCDAPSSLLQVQKQQNTPDEHLYPCSDKPNEPCDVYKEKGYCDTTAAGVNDANVQHRCRKTCGLCNCFDHDPSCSSSGKYCQSPNKTEQQHMYTTCPWTCGQCPGR